jgi:ligand-binding sensor domain-containing protein
VREVGNLHVTAFHQDDRGWLWVGAREGLFLYDGHTFRRATLPGDGTVTALHSYQGKVWVGMSTGQIAYRSMDLWRSSSTEELAFQPWSPEEGLPRKSISGFATDGAGRLWIATYGEGVYYYQNGRLYNLNALDEGLASDDIYTLVADNRGLIWVGTDAGVNTVRPSKPLHVATVSGLPDFIITALITDAKGNIWLGTHEKGLLRYNIAQNRFDFFTSSWPYGPVTALVVLGSAEIWVGTEENGLIRVDIGEGTWHPMPRGHALERGRILALFKDLEGILWVGPDKGGLWLANGRTSMLEVPLTQPMALVADSRGRLWVGGTEGLFVRQKEGFRQIAASQIRQVVALWADPFRAHLWVGTYNQGTFLLDTAGHILKHLRRSSGLPDDNVLAITGDGEQVFLATFGGVARVDKRTFDVGVVEGIKKGYIYTALLDRKGRFWFGTQGDGLYCLQGTHLSRYTYRDHSALKTVYSLTEDAYGNLWLSTERGGLLCFDGQHFRTLSAYVPNSLVVALKTNADGLLVMGSDDGFGWLPVQAGQPASSCFITVDLPPLGVGLNAACRDGQGHVWLGTTAGLWRIAAWGEPILSAPEPVITSILLLNQNTAPTSAQLAYEENYVEFTFDAVWYTQHSGLSFRYRLEGFDAGWISTQDHQAHYSRLPSGQYTFRVQASKCADFEHAREASWSFSIQPPFWQRWWFQLLAFSGLVALLYRWIRWREQRAQRYAQQQRQAAEAQLNALKAQVSPHFLFNSFNTLTAVIETNPQLAVEYVNRLSDFYRSLLTSQDRDYIELQEERARVNNYGFLLRMRYGEGFVLHDRLADVQGYVPPFSLQTLVENAVKHNIVSVHSPLVVELFADGEGYVVVRNNLQRRMAPAPGAQLGLKNLIQRVALTGAPPVVVEENDHYFIVKIPIRSAIF